MIGNFHTSDAFAIVFLFIAFHSDFMTTDDSLQAIVFAEPSSNIRSELHADTTFTWAAARLLLWIGP